MDIRHWHSLLLRYSSQGDWDGRVM